MKSFIKSLALFSCIIVLLILSAYTALDALGWSDWAYKRFRDSGEKSLVLGTSRAAQGIHPSVINEEMQEMGFELPIFNFSFTVTASPYGEIYYNSIIRKLSTENYQGGLFIVTVDPWSLSLTNQDTGNELREETDRLKGITHYIKPNFLYFWKYAKPLSFDNVMKLQDDGWLQVNVPMDSVSLHERIESKKREYADVKISKSDYRLKWLEKTIDLLKSKGVVFLVRIPATKYFFDIEEKSWSTFESDMNVIAKKKCVDYISFANALGRYQTIDGQHIYKQDGEKFTKDLCDSIKVRINKRNRND